MSRPGPAFQSPGHSAPRSRASRLIVWGDCPNVRKKARRMRSRSVKPFSTAITSSGCHPAPASSGPFHPQVLDGLRRRLTCLGAEGTAELAWAKIGGLGELFDAESPSKVLFCENERVLDAVGPRVHLQEGRMLRLSAGAPLKDDQVLGHLERQIEPVIPLDHAERHIDACGHAG